MERKIAIICLAAISPSGLSLISKYAAAANFDVYCHVDAKVDIEPFTSAIGAERNVIFTSDRVKVFWRGFSMIQATMATLSLARAASKYDSFLLISDDSVPIVDPSAMRNELKTGDRINARLRTDWGACQRYENYYMFDSNATQVRWAPIESRQVDLETVQKLLRLASLKIRGKATLKNGFFHGSQWWALTDESVSRLMHSYVSDAWLRESFEFSEVPDESYFATILSGKVTFSSKDFMFSDWSVNQPPRKITSLADLDACEFNGQLFARKVYLSVEEQDIYARRILGQVN